MVPHFTFLLLFRSGIIGGSDHRREGLVRWRRTRTICSSTKNENKLTSLQFPIIKRAMKCGIKSWLLKFRKVTKIQLLT